MASDSSSGFRPGASHVSYGLTKHNREDGRKEQTNKHGLGSASSAIRGNSVTVFVNSESKRERILERKSYKSHKPCWFLLTVSFSFSWLLSQADWSLLSFFVNCLSVSSFGPSFPRPLPVSWEISPTGPLWEFRAKTKRFSDRRQHNGNECYLLCHSSMDFSICSLNACNSCIA